MSKIVMKPTNECKVIVEPRSAGNFGIFSVSGIEREAEEEYNLCKQIESDIKRHIDDVQYTSIEQKELYTYNDEEYGEIESDTLFGLIYELAYQKDLIKEYPSWNVRYRYHNDKDTCRRDGITNFEELLEYFVDYEDVEIIKGKLTEEQQILIDVAKTLS